MEITEYELPESDSLPHDLVIGPGGRIWITAFFYDELWALDPASGSIERFSADDRPDVNAQPRALEFDAEGTLWVVNGGTEAVLRFDPGTGTYEEIPVGMYAHSLDIDPAGDIWVNDYFAAEERIARVAASDGPVLVLGDLNTSAFSPFFRRWVRDSGLHCPSPWTCATGTWPAPWRPLLTPIDHVLAKGALRVQRLKRGAATGSSPRATSRAARSS